MGKKLVNKLLRVNGLLILLVWCSGLFGIWGNLYGLLVMGLISVFFVLIFVGLISDDNFL